ncbi:MAG: helix-turn-helix domain-containing protein [Haloarculaceae archaeon]
MSIIAEFRVRSPDLVLAEALGAVPDMTLDLVKELGTNQQQPYLFFWAGGDDIPAFETAMEEDATVADIHRYTEADDSVLYRARITEETEVVSYPVWVEVGADQLEAQYADGWWHNRMRFPDREALSTVEEWCRDVGVDFDLERVYTDRPQESAEICLTDVQAETLRVALAEGYFEVPREASMGDLARDLDVSTQAVSERLRRAHRALVAEHLVPAGNG